MKVKHLFSVIGLGLFALAAAGAGVIGGSVKKANSVEADAPNTWMFRAQLDLGEASPNYEHCVIEEEHAVDGVQFHIWGANLDKTFDAAYMEFDTFDYYGVNVALRDDQTITGAQWILHQKDVGYKYSTDLNQFGDDATDHLDKDTTIVAIQWQYNHNWVDGKWTPYKDWGEPCFTLQMHIDGQEAVDMVKEPANGVFAARNMVHSVNGKWIEMISDGSVHLKYAFKEMLDEDSAALVHGGNDQWTYLNDTGTYDVIFDNDHTYIKKHQATDTVYIYYVLENGTPTNDYIYSWGGSEQFGSWPGTKVTSVEGVKEVTNNGVIRFQGGESTKLIYKIPVKTGYPVGDSKFKFNNNDTMETDARPISGHNAYWWSGDANGLAGYSLEFILQVEAIRNAAEDHSVCNISQESATSLVNTYLSLGNEMQQTYIDCTTVYTHKRDGSDGNEYVSYRFVIEELARIANIELGSGSRVDLSSNYEKYNATTLIAIISVVAISSVLVVTLVLVKRRQHN